MDRFPKAAANRRAVSPARCLVRPARVTSTRGKIGVLFRPSGDCNTLRGHETRIGRVCLGLRHDGGSNYILGGAGAMPTVGGCQCGDVRYEISGDPLALYICHCRECQKQSASSFGMSLHVQRADFRITQGEVRSWSRGTDSGNRLNCFFCPRCSSRLWHESDPPLDTVTIKAGSLDQAVDASDANHIWTSRALTGIVIPAAVTKFPEEPL
jgi:hypothetical protein